MELKLKDNFLYRVYDKEMDLKSTFNAFEDGVIRNNDKLDLYCGEIVKICVSNKILHIVKPAESIATIAKKYNVSEDELINQNNIKDKVFIGQRLYIDCQLSNS